MAAAFCNLHCACSAVPALLCLRVMPSSLRYILTCTRPHVTWNSMQPKSIPAPRILSSIAARARLLALLKPSLGGLLWRSAKADVAHELGLPPQARLWDGSCLLVLLADSDSLRLQPSASCPLDNLYQAQSFQLRPRPAAPPPDTPPAVFNHLLTASHLRSALPRSTTT